MPATAGRVRMPADNRLSVSDSLKSSEIWQKSVGYDPYAPGDVNGASSAINTADVEAKAKGLFALARLTGSSSSTTPGACKRCGQVGHLAYQCRNDMAFLCREQKAGNIRTCVSSSSDDDEEEDVVSDLSSEDSSSHTSSSRNRPSRKRDRRDRRKRHRHHRHRSPSSSVSLTREHKSRRLKHTRHVSHKRRRRSLSSSRSSGSVSVSARRAPCRNPSSIKAPSGAICSRRHDSDLVGTTDKGRSREYENSARTSEGHSDRRDHRGRRNASRRTSRSPSHRNCRSRILTGSDAGSRHPRPSHETR